MKCQDVNEILDNQRFDRIDALQWQQVGSHVATCADCARTWNAQSTLAALPDVAMPAGLQAQCLAAIGARFSSAIATGRSGRRRALLWGSLATFAAAAATLVLLSWPEARTDPAATVLAPRSEAAPPVVGAATVVQAVVAEPSVPRSADATAIKTSGTGAAPRFTVQVFVPEPPPVERKELYAIATDPAAREALQSLRAALVGELRKVPDLAMVDEDPVQITAPSRHYRLKLGPLLMMGVDGRPMRKDHRYDMALDVQEVQPGGKVIDLRMAAKLFAVEPRATCTSPDAAESTPCDVATTAVYLARHLRQQVFPPDASVTQPLQASLRDFSLAPEERFAAFVELYKQQVKAGGKSLLSNAEVVLGAVELSQLTDAAHRAQLWRALRGVGDALLIDPLLASMQQDPKEVRVAAAETLAADFSANPRARPALEAAAASDPDLLVRALARRGLSGEEAWQDYVVSSLKHSGLPASQRVEALLHVLYPPDTVKGVSDPSPSNYWQILENLDDASVRALAEVFPKAEQLRKWPGNNLVGNFAAKHNQNPAVKEMLLTVLEADTRALNRSVVGEVLAQTQASDPRVRDALNKAVRSDPDASVRDYLRQVLERDYVKKTMEAAPR